jgi:hypothetical protein
VNGVDNEDLGNTDVEFPEHCPLYTDEEFIAYIGE